MPDDKNKPQQTPTPPTPNPERERRENYESPLSKPNPPANPLEHPDTFIKKAPDPKKEGD